MKPSKVFFSEFKLESEFFWNSQTQSKTRDGVLLKVQFENLIGYSCYNPWPELGDETLQEGLKKQSTNLFQQALYWANVDAKARAENQCLRNFIKPLKNHQLIQDLRGKAKSDFTVYKIKMGRDLKTEGEFLEKHFSGQKLRLDFNGKMSFQEFSQWWNQLSAKIKNQVDFLEDPFDPSMASSPLGLDNPLWAWDFHQVENPHTVIVKPTRDLCSKGQRQIFTHSFDHPIGVVISHYAASQVPGSEQETHGLFYQNIHCNDGSEKEFQYEKNQMLIPRTGTGFGFDELLKEFVWKAL